MYVKVVSRRMIEDKEITCIVFHPLGNELDVILWPNEIIHLPGNKSIELDPKKYLPWTSRFVYLCNDNGDTAERLYNGHEKKE